MEPLAQQLTELFESHAGSAGEWPAYVVLQEVLPRRLQLLVAAKMAAELEQEPGFSKLLLDLFLNQEKEAHIDDYMLCPPASEHHERRLLIRRWLRADGSDSEAFRLIGFKQDADESKDSHANLLIEIGELRWSTVDEIAREHAEGRFSDPLLVRLAQGYTKLTHVLKSKHLANEDLTLPGSSELLALLWIKHFGDQCCLQGEYSLATKAYRLARDHLGRIPRNAEVAQLSLWIDLSLLSITALEQGPAVPGEALATLRKKHSGGPSADSVEYLAWQCALQRDILERQIPTGSPKPLLHWHAHEGVNHLSRLRERVLAKSAEGRFEEAEATSSVALVTAIAQGVLPFTSEIREARVHELLARKPPKLRSALYEMVLSGHTNTVKLLERLDPAETPELFQQIDDSYIRQLLALSQSASSAKPFRQGVLAQALSVLARYRGMSESTFLAILEVLLQLARTGADSIYDNIRAAKPSLDGLRSLHERNPWLVLNSHAIELVDAISSRLSSDATWPAMESALQLGKSCVAGLGDSEKESLIDRVLTVFEKHPSPENENWIELRAGFEFLTSDATLDTLKRRLDLMERARAQVIRYCFQDKESEFSQGWAYALGMARLLGISPLPESGRRVIKTTLAHAQEPNTSSSAPAVRTMLRHLELLSPDEVQELLRSLASIVSWRSSRGDGPVANLSTAQAVREVASFWSDIQRYGGEGAMRYCNQVFAACAQYFRDGAKKPSLFAPFSIPRKEKPDLRLVEYWATALLSIGSALGQGNEARVTLSMVEKEQPDFREPIARALADFDAFGGNGEFSRENSLTKEQIQGLSEGTFYATLGSNLTRIAKASDAAPVMKALLEKCLEVGPRNDDLSIFGMAAGYPTLHGSLSRESIQRYREKLRHLHREMDESCLVTLVRLLELFRHREQGENGR